MRISEIIASIIPKVRPIGPSSNTAGVQKAGKIHTRPDQVQLSDEGQVLSRLSAELKTIPEVDESRVTELRDKIDKGEYKVDENDLASKMLGME